METTAGETFSKMSAKDTGAPGGGAKIGAGSGLRGLQDRLSALDGTLVVESPPGGGTRMHARIPCGADALVAEAGDLDLPPHPDPAADPEARAEHQT